MKTKSFLCSKFDMKYMGENNVISGIKGFGGIVLSQSHYIVKVSQLNYSKAIGC